MSKKLYIYKSEYCVICGKEIPEGIQVCSDCESATVFLPEREEKSVVKPSFIERIFKEKRQKKT